MATIQMLGDLELFSIFLLLPAPDLARSGAVCRRWRALQAAHDRDLWGGLLVSVCPGAQADVAEAAGSPNPPAPSGNSSSSTPWRAAFGRLAGDLELSLVKDARFACALARAQLVGRLGAASSERDALRSALAVLAVPGSASVPAVEVVGGVPTLTHAPLAMGGSGASTLAASHAVADLSSRLASAEAACARLGAEMEGTERHLRLLMAGRRAGKEGPRGSRRARSPPRPVGKGLGEGEGLPGSVGGVEV